MIASVLIRKMTLVFALVVLALIQLNIAFAQFTGLPITGIAENSLHHLFVSTTDPTTMFTSTDTGLTWHGQFIPGGGIAPVVTSIPQ